MCCRHLPAASRLSIGADLSLRSASQPRTSSSRAAFWSTSSRRRATPSRQASSAVSSVRACSVPLSSRTLLRLLPPRLDPFVPPGADSPSRPLRTGPTLSSARQERATTGPRGTTPRCVSSFSLARGAGRTPRTRNDPSLPPNRAPSSSTRSSTSCTTRPRRATACRASRWCTRSAAGPGRASGRSSSARSARRCVSASLCRLSLCCSPSMVDALTL